MTKHKSSDERTTQILDAARTCFIKKGYFATKMDEIARQAGLSKGGVYFHFGSKREIFRALAERENERTQEFLDGMSLAPGTFREKIELIGAHFTSRFDSNDNPRFLVVVMEMSLRDKMIAELVATMQRSYAEKTVELLNEGIKSGQTRESIDVESTAFLLKAMIDGMQIAYVQPRPPEEAALLLKASLDLILNGLARDEA